MEVIIGEHDDKRDYTALFNNVAYNQLFLSLPGPLFIRFPVLKLPAIPDDYLKVPWQVVRV